MKKPLQTPNQARPPRPGSKSAAPQPTKKAAGDKEDQAPRARPLGSILLLAGAWLTVATMHGNTPSHLVHYVAVGVGFSLLISIYLDAKQGEFMNLVRPDLLAILSLYYLTLFEFLFKQERFDSLAGMYYTKQAVIATVIGFSGLVVGRHLVNFGRHPLKKMFLTPTPQPLLMTILVGCVVIGSLYMLMTVNFSVSTLFYYFVAPRFSQPWTRESLGDLKSLQHELELLLELVPPIAGVIFGRRKKFTKFQLLLTACCFLYVLFYAFSGGTRYAFAAHLVTFLIGYAFSQQGEKKSLIIVAGVCAALLVVSSSLMLQFRDMGLENYLKGGYRNVNHASDQELFVDYNLYTMVRIAEYIPGQHPYLGWEVPYLAVIRIVPRGLWHDKPEGMSIPVEDILDVSGMNVTETFVGESYMGWGWAGVLIAGLFFGALTAWWSRLVSARNSELGILIYASGFVAAVISMRSLYVFTTAILPTILAIVFGYAVAFLVSAFQTRRRYSPSKLPPFQATPRPEPRQLPPWARK